MLKTLEVKKRLLITAQVVLVQGQVKVKLSKNREWVLT
jgi:hypothetical protein